MSRQSDISRRNFVAFSAAGSLVLATGQNARAIEKPASEFKPKYILGSCMYGYKKLTEIAPEVAKTGAKSLDIWPKVHGNQREQLDEMGEAKFSELLKKHDVTLGCITQYKLGPFGIQQEMRLAKRLGCKTIVTGARGPKNLKGKELKAGVKKFIEQMKPHLKVAEETDVTIAIENHGSSLIDSPDSMRWLMDLRSSKNLGIAMAPYHLPQNEKLLCKLIKELGNKIAMFYAWQHGNGCMKKLPKEEELLQMPGRGKLNFVPIMKSLASVGYENWFEIFMHPVPRGIPIHPKTSDVTAEINKAREYLTKCLGNQGIKSGK